MSAPAGSVSERRIGGVAVAPLRFEDAAGRIADAIRERRPLHVAFANAHCINVAARRADYRAALAGFLVLPDGIGVDIASRWLHGATFPDNLNGTDFVPRLLETAEGPWRVALLGGEPGVAEAAAARFAARFPQHRFHAVRDGFFAPGTETDGVLAALREWRADLLLVATGVPRQELFIAAHVGAREAPVALGVGALLDFTAGRVSRAPEAVRVLRAEWLWRLAQEPRRLFARYLLGNPQFLARVALERARRSR